MKPTKDEIADLRKQISEKREAKGLTYAQIARISGVHSSQVWRICNDKFRTISRNVVEVCRVLGVETETVAVPPFESEPWWLDIEQSVRSLWDGTPEGARKIAKMCATVAELRSS